VAAGSLPPGLSLDTVTGMVQGTPRTVGSFSVTFSVTDGGGERATLETTMQIAPRLAVATKKLPRVEKGGKVNVLLKRTGGFGPVRWRIVRGAPPGIRLDRLTDRLRGVARAEGTYRITVEVRDALGVRARRVLVLVVTG
jgi:hypothetical protein